MSVCSSALPETARTRVPATLVVPSPSKLAAVLRRIWPELSVLDLDAPGKLILVFTPRSLHSCPGSEAEWTLVKSKPNQRLPLPPSRHQYQPQHQNRPPQRHGRQLLQQN